MSYTGWWIGYGIGIFVVLVVVALVVPILLLAWSIGKAAPLIDDQLAAAARNTAPLTGLNTTIKAVAAGAVRYAGPVSKLLG